MTDCGLCEYRGYSPEVCKMHRRHLVVAEKLASSEMRRLSAFDPKKAFEIIEREKRQKTLKQTGISAAVGAALGSGSGYAGIALAGGAAAAIASPLLLGAAIAGAGIAAAATLTHTKRSHGPCQCKDSDAMSSVFGFNKKKS